MDKIQFFPISWGIFCPHVLPPPLKAHEGQTNVPVAAEVGGDIGGNYHYRIYEQRTY